jgi:hypothetical protein
LEEVEEAEEVERGKEEEGIAASGMESDFFCLRGSRARFFSSRKRARKSVAVSSSFIALVGVLLSNTGGAMVKSGFFQLS